MSVHSDKTVSEIQGDLSTTDRPIDEEADDAAAEVLLDQPESTNALKMVALESIDYYPSVQIAREEAEVPEHISVKELVGKRILIARKSAQKAALPDTGELRDGFFCSCIDMATKKPFTTWFGQVALVRDLAQLSTPFQATIAKHGRTYRFE